MIALVLTVAVSCTTAINPGVLAVVFAWVIGTLVAPMMGESIGMADVVKGFLVF